MFAVSDGAKQGRVGVQVALHPDFVICSREGKIVAFDRRELLVDKEVTDRKGKKRLVKVLAPPVWSIDLPPGALAPPPPRSGPPAPGRG